MKDFSILPYISHPSKFSLFLPSKLLKNLSDRVRLRFIDPKDMNFVKEAQRILFEKKNIKRI